MINIPISKVKIDQETKEAVLNILDSGHLVAGEYITRLEDKFSSLCRTKHAVAVTSGTAALHTALSILKIGQGDEVITTPFTYVATANTICMTGATPVFVDIDPVTFNIDPSKIEAEISSKTKAILTVDLYGLPADYKMINRIAKAHKLYVIEDAAQAVGASYYGKMTGSLGNIGCFSMYATKNLMAGEGGMLTTDKKSYEVMAKRFRNHGEYAGVKYDYKTMGHNYCPTDIVGAICLGQLTDFFERTKRRQQIASKYSHAFLQLPGVVVPTVPKHLTHVYHQYTLRITKPCPITRDQLQQKLTDNGITSRIYYPSPLSKLPHLNTKKRNYILPIVNRAAKEVLSIPVHPYLTDNEVDYICDSVTKIIKHKS